MELINYEQQYQPDFKRLNMVWLEEFNLLESHDLEILDDPQGTVLDNGGAIFLVKDGEHIVGTAGLWKESDDEYELIKMAVDPGYRGKGISRLLIDHCLSYAHKKQVKKISLYSNSQLKVALSLYEKYGFRYVDAAGGPFVTADIKMEIHL